MTSADVLDRLASSTTSPSSEPSGEERGEGSSESAAETRRAAMIAKIPSWYRPSIHLAIPTILGLFVFVAAASMLRDLRPGDLLTVPITLFAGFAFEWRAHKFILHRRRPLLGTLYVRHELIHHVVFTYDRMAMRSSRELWLILMPAYAIVLLFFMLVPLVSALWWLLSPNVALLMLMTSMLFFLSYEWLHMAYHLPSSSWLGGRRVVAKLRELHRRHHDPPLMKRWNFNVTVPVFDVILGTLWSPERARRRAAKTSE